MIYIPANPEDRSHLRGIGPEDLLDGVVVFQELHIFAFDQAPYSCSRDAGVLRDVAQRLAADVLAGSGVLEQVSADGMRTGVST